MLNTLISADTQSIDEKHTGKFISNLTYDVMHITSLLSNGILNLFKDSLTLIGLLAVMFFQNWKLSLIAIILIPIASITARSFGKRMGKVTTQAQEKSSFLKYLFNKFSFLPFEGIIIFFIILLLLLTKQIFVSVFPMSPKIIIYLVV